MSLTNGTTCTDHRQVKDTFSIKDIDKITDFCKARGVTSFEYLGLKLVLEASTESPETVVIPTRNTKRKARTIARRTDDQESYNMAQEFTETLHLEDPAAYERAIVEGELGEEEV